MTRSRYRVAGKPDRKGRGRPVRFGPSTERIRINAMLGLDGYGNLLPDRSEHDAAFKRLSRWSQENQELIDGDWWRSLFDDLDIEGEDTIINVADHLRQLLIIENQNNILEV